MNGMLKTNNVFAFPSSPTSYNYGAVEPALAQEMKAAVLAIRKFDAEREDRAARIGAELIRIKDKLPHGAWLPWVECEFAWTARYAQYLMRAAKGIARTHHIRADMEIEIDDELDDLNIFMETRMKRIPMEIGMWAHNGNNPDLYYREKPDTSCEWYTNKHVFNAMETHFDLDPSHPGTNIVDWIPVDRVFTITDDGLAQAWEGFVWLNPPFGRQRLIKWTRKFIAHANGVVLIPERTSTIWYQELEAVCGLILHMKKKVAFISPKGLARTQFPIGSHLIAMGEKGVTALINAHRNGLGLLSKPFVPSV
jgi:hypothetical protein